MEVEHLGLTGLASLLLTVGTRPLRVLGHYATRTMHYLTDPNEATLMSQRITSKVIPDKNLIVNGSEKVLGNATSVLSRMSRTEVLKRSLMMFLMKLKMSTIDNVVKMMKFLRINLLNNRIFSILYTIFDNFVINNFVRILEIISWTIRNPIIPVCLGFLTTIFLKIQYDALNPPRSIDRDIFDLSNNGFDAQDNPKTDTNNVNDAGTTRQSNISVIMPRRSEFDPEGVDNIRIKVEPRHPTMPLGDYERDRKFISKNNNKRSLMSLNHLTDFFYFTKKLHNTQADIRNHVPFDLVNYFDTIFNFKTFFTEIEYEETQINNNIIADLRPDLNATGLVKHWNNNVDVYRVHNYTMTIRPGLVNSYFDYLITRIPNRFRPFVYKTVYNYNYLYDILPLTQKLHVSQELVQNTSTLKTINKNLHPSSIRQTCELSVMNSSSVNVSRAAITNGQYIFTDTTDMLMHLYWRKIFVDSIYRVDESVFRL
jgi:hypothetical protein